MTAGRRFTSLGLAVLLALAATGSWSQSSRLAPLEGSGAEVPAPWRVVLVPKQKAPPTKFTLVDMDGTRALRVEANASYGNLVHEVDAAAGPARKLSWRWRLERPLVGVDLSRKSGDDTSLKVCALFNLAIEHVPFFERQLLRLARVLTGEPLPAATVCYLWEPSEAAGRVIRNAYSQRVRYLVLQGQGAPLVQWQAEQRDLHADFLRAFGDETSEVPPLIAVLVGADADNTASQSLGYVAALELRP